MCRSTAMRASIILLIAVCISCCHGHGNHGHDSGSPQEHVPADQFNFHDPKITQDEEHIKEHLKDQINTNRQMSPEEMEFHYFRLHDANNDTKLDGIELLAALNHMRHMFKVQPHERIGKTESQIQLLEKERSEGALRYFTDIIDKVLITDDMNRDGYVSYPEFMAARRRDYAAYQQQMAQYQQQQQMAMQAQAQQFQQWQQYQQWQQQQGQQQGNMQPGQQQGQPNVQQFQQPPPPPPPQGAPAKSS